MYSLLVRSMGQNNLLEFVTKYNFELIVIRHLIHRNVNLSSPYAPQASFVASYAITLREVKYTLDSKKVYFGHIESESVYGKKTIFHIIGNSKRLKVIVQICE
uniref:SJCHGC03898 protein n=1 Tax=Schistosoma japonicum TaxID=6182 RepID=Q5DCU9_SCHJA|nr:SJCHGC03898 protein [Schistosoma japonicum]